MLSLLQKPTSVLTEFSVYSCAKVFVFLFTVHTSLSKPGIYVIHNAILPPKVSERKATSKVFFFSLIQPDSQMQLWIWNEIFKVQVCDCLKVNNQSSDRLLTL